MAKTQFILEADEARAVQGFLKLIEAQDKTTAGLRKMNREGQKAGKSLRDVGSSISGWLSGFLSMAGVVQGLKEIVAEMEKATRLRKEMHDVALTTEQLTMKIAHLRKDVSEGGISAVTKDVAEISKQTAISLETAANALFMAESAMGPGTQRARTAALTIGQFAAPAGLMPEEVRLVPKIFDINRAYTKEQQLRILNQLQTATGASIAETGEFIQPFITPMTLAMQQGFTFEQSLAQMVAAIQTTGTVERAGTAARASLQIAGGRTKKALSFYQKEAGKRGIDFGRLTGPERYEFVRSLFMEAEAAGPEAMDVFKTTVGGKGFMFMQAMFGEAGRRKYFEVLPGIEAARGADSVQRMAEQYKRLLSAEATILQTQEQLAKSRIGRERRPGVILDQLTKSVLDEARALTRGYGEVAEFAVTPRRMEENIMARSLVRENILLALETAGKGTPERAQLLDLYKEMFWMKPLTGRPELLGRAYGLTGGFGMIEQRGRLADISTIKDVREELGFPTSVEDLARRGPYMRGLRHHYGIEDVKKQTILLEEIRDLLQIRVSNSNVGVLD